MKAHVKLDLVVDFPADVFSDENECITLIDQKLRDLLYVAVDYSDNPQDYFGVDHMEITKYKKIKEIS